MTALPDLPPAAVLQRYALDRNSVVPLPGGLINRSFGVRGQDGGEFVLQRVNPIFPPEIHQDIDAVTRHLAGRGLTTPRLVATPEGELFLAVDGAVWRLLTRIPGETQEALASDAEAREAGRVLGEFHRALADFDAPLRNRRPPVHELPRHLAYLERTLETGLRHPAHREVVRIANGILAMAARIAPPETQPPRLVHGDPKISNIVFRDADGSAARSSGAAGQRERQAVCLVDLDTLTRMPVALEIGDALRSWCNTAAEDSPAAAFSIGRCAAAIAGYRQAAGDLLTPAEWQAVPAATQSIAVELAARFAADALNESYFSWDRQRYASASEHNRARAEAQLQLADSIATVIPLMQQSLMTKA